MSEFSCVPNMWPCGVSCIAVVVLLVTSARSAVLAQHLIYKCCQDGYYLNNKEECVKGGPLQWAPAVYSPSIKGFLHPGTVPPDWHYQLSRPKQCARPTFAYYEPNVYPPFVLVPNGSLILTSEVSVPIPPENYCIDYSGALICFEQNFTENDSITVQKCCGIGGEYSEVKESCSPAEKDHPDFKTIQLKTVERFPDCSEPNYVIGGKLNTTHWLQEDGTLKDTGGRLLPKTQYCLEKILEYPEQPIHIFTCPPRVKPRHAHDIRFTLYPMGLFLSVFFLAVTLIASCLLPSTYHVLHWRCQTNHVACLLIGDLLLAVTQLSSDALQGPACIGIGMFIK
uniref:G-protein coupled receptor Mth-like 1 n=1 Tax=Rhodnius prolixus TaxID=13249 RepID=T1HD18_RHOPR